jgi:hypothetical protein
MAETLTEFYDLEEEAFKCNLAKARYPNSPYQDWLENSFANTLHSNSQICSKMGVSSFEVKQSLKKSRSALAPKKLFQRVATSMIAKQLCIPSHGRIFHKLERWHKQFRLTTDKENPNLMVERVKRRLTFSASHLSPKIHAAHFRTIWNGWCTDRRFQVSCNSLGCRFGCGECSDDSIEHYSCCPYVKRFHEHLHLPLRGTFLANFLGLCEQGREGELNVRLIALYACYKVHSILTHSPALPLDTFKLLKEAAITAVLGDHCNSMWLTHFTSNFNAPPPSRNKGYKRSSKGPTNSAPKCMKAEFTWITAPEIRGGGG